MQKRTEDMAINELIIYYLEGSKVANGSSVTAEPGSERTVFAETSGGAGYTTPVKAIAWGRLESEPAVLLKLPGDKHYALSYKTYGEICSLLSRNLADCRVIKGHTRSAAKPGALVYATPEGSTTLQAEAWYEIPPGDLKLFEVDGKQYAISLAAPKTISQRILHERKAGKFANPDPQREIIWHNFNLSGRGVAEPNFPCKPDYLS